MKRTSLSAITIAIIMLVVASTCGQDAEEVTHGVALRVTIAGDPRAQDTFAVHYSGMTQMLQMKVLCGPLGPNPPLPPLPSEGMEPCQDGETYPTTL